MVSVVGIWLFVCPCGVILRGRLEMCVGRRGGGVVWESMVKVYLRLRQCKINLTYF